MLEWNVFVSDIYSSKITVFNLFDHYGFVYGCEDILKNTNISKEEFALDVQKELLYFFRGKSEWEIILKPVFSLGELFENRIDVFYLDSFRRLGSAGGILQPMSIVFRRL